MKRMRLTPLILVTALFSFLLASHAGAQCGHGGYSTPPSEDTGPEAPSTDGTPGMGEATYGPAGPASPSTSGPSTTGAGPLKPTTKRAGGAGGMTKKARGVSTNFVNWEVWWARNRYQFFEIKDVYENSGHLYPGTGTAKIVGPRNSLFALLKGDSAKAIIPYLDDEAPLLRRISLFALGRIKDASAVDLMIERLQENNLYVRDAAVLGLGINGSAEARHIIMHIALGTDEACRVLGQNPVPAYVRCIAIVTLSLTKTPGMEPVLQSIALDADAPEDVRAMAFEGLGLLGGKGAAEFLAKSGLDPRLPSRLASHALSALGKTGEPCGLPTLRKGLHAKDLFTRQAAAMAMWRMAPAGDESLVKQLHLVFNNTNDQAVKGFSLVSMGLIGGPQAVKHLNRIVQRGKSSERAWACLGMGFALRKEKDAGAEDQLIRWTTGSGNRSTRSAACVALGLCKSEKAVPQLIRILEKGDNPYLRGYAAMALGMINDPRALEPLRTAMKKDRLPQVLSQSVLALGLMHDLESAPDLMECMVETPNIVIKGMISRALQYMGEAGVVEELLDRLINKRYDVRTTKECICLLSRMLSGQTSPYLDRLSANTNFVCEYPVINHMLQYGL